MIVSAIYIEYLNPPEKFGHPKSSLIITGAKIKCLLSLQILTGHKSLMSMNTLCEALNLKHR